MTALRTLVDDWLDDFMNMMMDVLRCWNLDNGLSVFWLGVYGLVLEFGNLGSKARVPSSH